MDQKKQAAIYSEIPCPQPLRHLPALAISLRDAPQVTFRAILIDLCALPQRNDSQLVANLPSQSLGSTAQQEAQTGRKLLLMEAKLWYLNTE